MWNKKGGKLRVSGYALSIRLSSEESLATYVLVFMELPVGGRVGGVQFISALNGRVGPLQLGGGRFASEFYAQHEVFCSLRSREKKGGGGGGEGI